MEVVVKSNPANAPMHYGPYVAGVLPVPDSHITPVLFSHYEATKEFNKINQDIFEQKQKAKSIDRKKTPKPVLIAAGGAILFTLYKIIKRRFK